MVVKVLSDDFKLREVLDKIIYLKYNERLCRAGYASITIPFDKTHYEALKPPSRLLIEDMPYTVERIRCTKSTIEIYARGIFHDFRHFAITEPRTLEGTGADIVCTLAGELSFNGADYKVYGITDTSLPIQKKLEWCTSYEGVITRLCIDNGLYFRIILDSDSKELRFLVDKQIDRSVQNSLGYSVISDRRTPFLDLEFTRDMSNYKTRIEFLYRINAIQSYSSIVYDKTPSNELKRTYSEAPQIIADTSEEVEALLEKRVGEIFERYRKTNELRVRISGKSTHRVGQICLFESEMLGESYKVAISKREYVLNRGEEYEELVLEVI